MFGAGGRIALVQGSLIGIEEQTITVTMGQDVTDRFGFGTMAVDGTDFGSLSSSSLNDGAGGTIESIWYDTGSENWRFRTTITDNALREQFRLLDFIIEGHTPETEPTVAAVYPETNPFHVNFAPSSGLSSSMIWDCSLGDEPFGYGGAPPTGWSSASGTRDVTIRWQTPITQTLITVTQGTSDGGTYNGYDENDYTDATTASFGSVDIDRLPNGTKIRALVWDNIGFDNFWVVVDGDWSDWGPRKPIPFLGVRATNLVTAREWLPYVADAANSVTYDAVNNTTIFKWEEIRASQWDGTGNVDVRFYT